MFVHARLTEGDFTEDAYDGAAFESSTALAMIVQNRLAATVTGASHSIAHLLNADKNESAECIQGSPRDMIDMVNQAKKGGIKYSMMQFTVAPRYDMSREDFLTYVLPLLAMVFCFQQFRCVIFEHLKRPEDRANGGSLRHWHICISYVDPLTGKVNRGWRMSHAKCERVGREIEAMGLDGPYILRGRFQPAVIAQLRSEGKHALADKIEAAHAPEPKGRTAPLEIEQPAKAAGIDLREIAKQVKAAFYASDDHPSLSAKLADIGLELRITNRGKSPAWAIYNGPDDSSNFVNLLSRCLPGVSRASIINIVEKNYGSGQDHGNERRAEAAEHAGLDQQGGAAVAEGAAFEPHVAAEPRGPGKSGVAGDGRAEQLFVEALGELDRDTSALDRLLADANALAWGTAATFVRFFRKVEQRARRWLDDGVTKFAGQRPEPDATLKAVRAEGEQLKLVLGNWNTAVHKHSLRISRLLGQPAPSIVGTKAHKDRMADAQSLYNSAEKAQKEAADAYNAHQDRARLFEDELEKRQARWDSKMDTIANKWLAVATAALETMKRFPRLVQYGPEAVFLMGMTRHGEPAPKPKPSDDYTSKGPRGPK